MATSAEIGAGNSRYTGDAGLGTGSFGAVKLDTRPIEDLAKYTFLYNKSEYDQRQKDVEAAAKEAASLMAYDITSSIPEDAEHLKKRFEEVEKFYKDNAVNYRDRDVWLQYKKMRNDLENDITGGNVRSLMNVNRQKEIQDAKSPAEKARLQKLLDEEIKNTDIRTPLKYSEQFDVKPIEVSAAPRKKVQVTEIGKNFVGQDNWDLPDMDAVSTQANTIVSGLTSLYDFENTDSFKLKTPQEQDLIRKQFDAQSASGKLEPIESAKNFNTALSSVVEAKGSDGNFLYKKEDGTIDYQKIIDDGKDPMGVLEQAVIYNSKMDEMTGAINNRWFKDDFGNELHFSNDASGLKKRSYAKINLEDGLSPEELVKMRILGTSAATSRTVKVDETDLDIKKQKLEIEKGQLGVSWYNAKTSRISATKPSGSSSAANPKTIDTPAILFGEHINRIKTFFDKNKSAPGLAVPYASLDNKTIKALNIEDGQRVVYSKDGGYVIESGSGNEWTRVRVGTVEDLKQGFINTVKAGQSGDGTQSEGFQENAEQGFNSIFGTSSGTVIFNNWGKPQQVTTAPAPSNNDAALTDAEYFLKYKKQKPK